MPAQGQLQFRFRLPRGSQPRWVRARFILLPHVHHVLREELQQTQGLLQPCQRDTVAAAHH